MRHRAYAHYKQSYIDNRRNHGHWICRSHEVPLNHVYVIDDIVFKFAKDAVGSPNSIISSMIQKICDFDLELAYGLHFDIDREKRAYIIRAGFCVHKGVHQDYFALKLQGEDAIKEYVLGALTHALSDK
jgi:hypothetical protein